MFVDQLEIRLVQLAQPFAGGGIVVGVNEDVLPGGEIAFSIAQNIFSENLGFIWVDDLLTDRGRILGVANQDLIAAFLPTAPLPEHIGLGAVQFMDDGEIFFSVQNAFYHSFLFCKNREHPPSIHKAFLNICQVSLFI